MLDLSKALLRRALETDEVKEFVNVADEQVAESDKMELVDPSDIDETIIQAETFIDENGRYTVDLLKMAMYYVQGYNVTTMAKIFGMHPRSIKRIYASDKFKSIVSIATREIVVTARNFLSASGLKAVTTIIDCMNSPDDRVRLQAATQVLDRIGIKTPEQIEVISTDKLDQMTDAELVEFVKKGMKDILPSVDSVKGGGDDSQ